MHEMIAARDQLRALGYDGWIHPDYDFFVRGEKQDIIERTFNGEHAAVKREQNYLRVHYKHICESDGVLVVNLEKNGIKNYIGGNALIEMGLAFYLKKSMYLLNPIPEISYKEEILGMQPIILADDLTVLR